MAFRLQNNIGRVQSVFHQQFGRFPLSPKRRSVPIYLIGTGLFREATKVGTVTQSPMILCSSAVTAQPVLFREANTASWSIGLMVFILMVGPDPLLLRVFWRLQRPAKPYGRRRIWTSDPSLSFCALPIPQSLLLCKDGPYRTPKTQVNRSFKIGNSLGGGFGLVIICRYDNGHTR